MFNFEIQMKCMPQLWSKYYVKKDNSQRNNGLLYNVKKVDVCNLSVYQILNFESVWVKRLLYMNIQMDN